MTGSHIIFSRSREDVTMTPKYAQDVRVGDLLVQEDTGQEAEVMAISQYSSVGYYSPLTYEGTMVVDGYLASCYASFPHYVAHAALAPARAWPSLVLGDQNRGTPAFVSAIKTMGHLLNLRNTLPAVMVRKEL